MTIYNFVQRDSKTGSPKIVASVNVSSNGNKWSGNQATRIRKWLKTEIFLRLPGNKFKESNKKHWKLLPDLVSGSYFWVQEVKDKVVVKLSE